MYILLSLLISYPLFDLLLYNIIGFGFIKITTNIAILTLILLYILSDAKHIFKFFRVAFIAILLSIINFVISAKVSTFHPVFFIKVVTIAYIGYILSIYIKNQSNSKDIELFSRANLFLFLSFIVFYIDNYDLFTKYLNISDYFMNVEGYFSYNLLDGWPLNSFQWVDGIDVSFRFIGPSLNSLTTGYLMTSLVLFLLLSSNISVRNGFDALILASLAVLIFLRPSLGALLSLTSAIIVLSWIKLFKVIHLRRFFFISSFGSFLAIWLIKDEISFSHSSFYRHFLDLALFPEILLSHPMGIGLKSFQDYGGFSQLSVSSDVLDVHGGYGAESGLIEILQQLGLPGVLALIILLYLHLGHIQRNNNIGAFVFGVYLIATSIFHKAPMIVMPGVLMWLLYFYLFTTGGDEKMKNNKKTYDDKKNV